MNSITLAISFSTEFLRQLSTVYVKHIGSSGIDQHVFYHDRNSRPEVFCKEGVLRNFTKFTGKHLCQRLFFNKVAGLRSATLLKKSLWHRCFFCEFCKISKNTFFYRTRPVAASAMILSFLIVIEFLSLGLRFTLTSMF